MYPHLLNCDRVKFFGDSFLRLNNQPHRNDGRTKMSTTETGLVSVYLLPECADIQLTSWQGLRYIDVQILLNAWTSSKCIVTAHWLSELPSFLITKLSKIAPKSPRYQWYYIWNTFLKLVFDCFLAMKKEHLCEQ